MKVNNNVKIILTFEDHKRFASFVRILITIDNKIKRHGVTVVHKKLVHNKKLPPRDSAGRFIKTPKPLGEKVEAKARKKCGPSLLAHLLH